MYRFFLTSDQFEKEKPEILGSDVRHMVKVLRIKLGDVVEILDGSGRAATARVEYLGKDMVGCLRLEDFLPGGEPPLKVTLVQGLAKGDKMDLIIQKCTELGVAEIIPLICQRSVVRLDDSKGLGKQERWQRVAMESAKQCRRARIPVVKAPQNLDQVLDSSEGTASFLPWEGENCFSWKKGLQGDNPGQVYLFIGPEGGFDVSEVEKARLRGVTTVTLGPRILRTETAGMACLAVIMYKWGDLG